MPSVPGSALASRSFSRDPKRASTAVAAAVAGWRAGGVAATAKHFPGLGAATVNTDDGSVTIRRSRSKLLAGDLPPFAAAIRAGVPLVMVSHARYTALDRNHIASQSRAIVEGLLRGRLGFRGVVITDSMEAAALARHGEHHRRVGTRGAGGRGSRAVDGPRLVSARLPTSTRGGAAFGVVSGARAPGRGPRAGPEGGSIVGDLMAESGIDVSIEQKDEPAPADGKRHPNTCPSCGSHYRDEELRAALRVCSQCGHHFPMPARERIAYLADPGSFDEEAADVRSADPLEFFDLRPYRERLAEAELQTGLGEAIVIGRATLDRHDCQLSVMDFSFLGGSMGSAVGEKLVRACESAAERQVPLISVTASGGARMQEGILSLMQLPKTVCAVEELHESGGALISVALAPWRPGGTVRRAAVVVMGIVLVADDQVEVPDHPVGHVAVQVEGHRDRDRRPDDRADARRQPALGVVRVGRDHRAVAGEEHAVDRPGIA